VISKIAVILQRERKNKTRPKFISFVRDEETKTNTSANTSLLNEFKNLKKTVGIGTHMQFS